MGASAISRAPLLLASWLTIAGCMLGCETPPAAYPSTEAERAGIERAGRDATLLLDCEEIEVAPVVPREVCAAGECEMVPASLGSELVARGCGEEMRFYCDGACGNEQRHRAYCVPEHLVGRMHCDAR